MRDVAWLPHPRHDCVLGRLWPRRVDILMTRAIVLAALIGVALYIPIAGAKAAHDAAQYVEVK